MVVPQDAASLPDEEKSSVGETPEWKCEADGTRAAWLYKSKLLAQHETRKAVVLQMDLRESINDQERSLISFYKEPKVEWANPVSCKLEGNTDVTRLFDGEPDHLTPSSSQTLLESDMFLVAATIQIEDCPDIDIRSTIQLLNNSAELTEQDKRSDLERALSWDLPGVAQTNQRWLYERLLFHAVITRTSRQVKQLRKGLKETIVWPLLAET
ncbi:hypothetical protein GJAV_G00125900 [Gymnothorax javanicus]|nr:hypothetical protein GJAV_G00125900 [Gymnothorax javanicus]